LTSTGFCASGFFGSVTVSTPFLKLASMHRLDRAGAELGP
jgi:hypothetical protein